MPPDIPLNQLIQRADAQLYGSGGMGQQHPSVPAAYGNVPPGYPGTGGIRAPGMIQGGAPPGFDQALLQRVQRTSVLPDQGRMPAAAQPSPLTVEEHQLGLRAELSPGQSPYLPLQQAAPSVPWSERTKAMNLTMTPEGMAQHFRQLGFEAMVMPHDKYADRENPMMSEITMGEGYNIAIKEPTSGSWHVLDPQQFEASDLTDILSDAAITVASIFGANYAGAAAGAARQTASMAARKAAASFVAKKGVQGAVKKGLFTTAREAAELAATPSTFMGSRVAGAVAGTVPIEGGRQALSAAMSGTGPGEIPEEGAGPRIGRGIMELGASAVGELADPVMNLRALLGMRGRGQISAFKKAVADGVSGEELEKMGLPKAYASLPTEHQMAIADALGNVGTPGKQTKAQQKNMEWLTREAEDLLGEGEEGLESTASRGVSDDRPPQVEVLNRQREEGRSFTSYGRHRSSELKAQGHDIPTRTETFDVPRDDFSPYQGGDIRFRAEGKPGDAEPGVSPGLKSRIEDPESGFFANDPGRTSIDDLTPEEFIAMTARNNPEQLGGSLGRADNIKGETIGTQTRSPTGTVPEIRKRMRAHTKGGPDYDTGTHFVMLRDYIAKNPASDAYERAHEVAMLKRLEMILENGEDEMFYWKALGVHKEGNKEGFKAAAGNMNTFASVLRGQEISGYSTAGPMIPSLKALKGFLSDAKPRNGKSNLDWLRELHWDDAVREAENWRFDANELRAEKADVWESMEGQTDSEKLWRWVAEKAEEGDSVVSTGKNPVEPPEVGGDMMRDFLKNKELPLWTITSESGRSTGQPVVAYGWRGVKVKNLDFVARENVSAFSKGPDAGSARPRRAREDLLDALDKADEALKGIPTSRIEKLQGDLRAEQAKANKAYEAAKAKKGKELTKAEKAPLRKRADELKAQLEELEAAREAAEKAVEAAGVGGAAHMEGVKSTAEKLAALTKKLERVRAEKKSGTFKPVATETPGEVIQKEREVLAAIIRGDGGAYDKNTQLRSDLLNALYAKSKSSGRGKKGIYAGPSAIDQATKVAVDHAKTLKPIDEFLQHDWQTLVGRRRMENEVQNQLIKDGILHGHAQIRSVTGGWDEETGKGISLNQAYDLLGGRHHPNFTWKGGMKARDESPTGTTPGWQALYLTLISGKPPRDWPLSPWAPHYKVPSDLKTQLDDYLKNYIFEVHLGDGKRRILQHDVDTAKQSLRGLIGEFASTVQIRDGGHSGNWFKRLRDHVVDVSNMIKTTPPERIGARKLAMADEFFNLDHTPGNYKATTGLFEDLPDSSSTGSASKHLKSWEYGNARGHPVDKIKIRRGPNDTDMGEGYKGMVNRAKKRIHEAHKDDYDPMAGPLVWRALDQLHRQHKDLSVDVLHRTAVEGKIPDGWDPTEPYMRVPDPRPGKEGKILLSTAEKIQHGEGLAKTGVDTMNEAWEKVRAKIEDPDVYGENGPHFGIKEGEGADALQKDPELLNRLRYLGYEDPEQAFKDGLTTREAWIRSNYGIPENSDLGKSLAGKLPKPDGPSMKSDLADWLENLRTGNTVSSPTPERIEVWRGTPEKKLLALHKGYADEVTGGPGKTSDLQEVWEMAQEAGTKAPEDWLPEKLMRYHRNLELSRGIEGVLDERGIAHTKAAVVEGEPFSPITAASLKADAEWAEAAYQKAPGLDTAETALQAAVRDLLSPETHDKDAIRTKLFGTKGLKDGFFYSLYNNGEGISLVEAQKLAKDIWHKREGGISGKIGKGYKWIDDDQGTRTQKGRLQELWEGGGKGDGPDTKPPEPPTDPSPQQVNEHITALGKWHMRDGETPDAARKAADAIKKYKESNPTAELTEEVEATLRGLEDTIHEAHPGLSGVKSEERVSHGTTTDVGVDDTPALQGTEFKALRVKMRKKKAKTTKTKDGEIIVTPEKDIESPVRAFNPFKETLGREEIKEALEHSSLATTRTYILEADELPEGMVLPKFNMLGKLHPESSAAKNGGLLPSDKIYKVNGQVMEKAHDAERLLDSAYKESPEAPVEVVFIRDKTLYSTKFKMEGAREDIISNRNAPSSPETYIRRMETEKADRLATAKTQVAKKGKFSIGMYKGLAPASMTPEAHLILKIAAYKNGIKKYMKPSEKGFQWWRTEAGGFWPDEYDKPVFLNWKWDGKAKDYVIDGDFIIKGEPQYRKYKGRTTTTKERHEENLKGMRLGDLLERLYAPYSTPHTPPEFRTLRNWSFDELLELQELTRKNYRSHVEEWNVRAPSSTGRGANMPGLRERATLELQYSTGMRAKEAVWVHLEELEAGGVLKLIRNKADKITDVEFTREALKSHTFRAMKEYLDWRKSPGALKGNNGHGPNTFMRPPEFQPRGRGKLAKTGGTPVFIGDRGKRADARSINSAIKKAVPDGARITSHDYRHRLATHMAEGGASMGMIKEILGHTPGYNTETYIRQHGLDRLAADGLTVMQRPWGAGDAPIRESTVEPLRITAASLPGDHIVKLTSGDVKVLNIPQMEAILAAPKRFAKDTGPAEALRNEALFWAIFGTGRRVASIAEFKVSNFLDVATAEEIKKSPMLTAFQNWVNYRRDNPLSDAIQDPHSDYIFTRTAKPKVAKPKNEFIATNSIREIFTKYRNKMKGEIPSNTSPKSLRHSFATHMLDQSEQLRQINAILEGPVTQLGKAKPKGKGKPKADKPVVVPPSKGSGKPEAETQIDDLAEATESWDAVRARPAVESKGDVRVHPYTGFFGWTEEGYKLVVIGSRGERHYRGRTIGEEIERLVTITPRSSKVRSDPNFLSKYELNLLTLKNLKELEELQKEIHPEIAKPKSAAEPSTKLSVKEFAEQEWVPDSWIQSTKGSSRDKAPGKKFFWNPDKSQWETVKGTSAETVRGNLNNRLDDIIATGGLSYAESGRYKAVHSLIEQTTNLIRKGDPDPAGLSGTPYKLGETDYLEMPMDDLNATKARLQAELKQRESEGRQVLLADQDRWADVNKEIGLIDAEIKRVVDDIVAESKAKADDAGDLTGRYSWEEYDGDDLTPDKAREITEQSVEDGEMSEADAAEIYKIIDEGERKSLKAPDKAGNRTFYRKVYREIEERVTELRQIRSLDEAAYRSTDEVIESIESGDGKFAHDRPVGHADAVTMNQLQIDPEMQFRPGAGEGGVVAGHIGKPFKAWKHIIGESLHIWVDREGNHIVVDGHHRFSQMRRLIDEGKIPATKKVATVIFREDEGVSKETAKALGVYYNVIQGKGSEIDYLEAFTTPLLSAKQKKEMMRVAASRAEADTHRKYQRVADALAREGSPALVDAYKQNISTRGEVGLNAAQVEGVLKAVRDYKENTGGGLPSGWSDEGIHEAGIWKAKKDVSGTEMEIFIKKTLGQNFDDAAEGGERQLRFDEIAKDPELIKRLKAVDDMAKVTATLLKEAKAKIKGVAGIGRAKDRPTYDKWLAAGKDRTDNYDSEHAHYLHIQSIIDHIESIREEPRWLNDEIMRRAKVMDGEPQGQKIFLEESGTIPEGGGRSQRLGTFAADDLFEEDVARQNAQQMELRIRRLIEGEEAPQAWKVTDAEHSSEITRLGKERAQPGIGTRRHSELSAEADDAYVESLTALLKERNSRRKYKHGVKRVSVAEEIESWAANKLDPSVGVKNNKHISEYSYVGSKSGNTTLFNKIRGRKENFLKNRMRMEGRREPLSELHVEGGKSYRAKRLIISPKEKAALKKELGIDSIRNKRMTQEELDASDIVVARSAPYKGHPGYTTVRVKGVGRKSAALRERLIRAPGHVVPLSGKSLAWGVGEKFIKVPTRFTKQRAGEGAPQPFTFYRADGPYDFNEKLFKAGIRPSKGRIMVDSMPSVADFNQWMSEAKPGIISAAKWEKILETDITDPSLPLKEAREMILMGILAERDAYGQLPPLPGGMPGRPGGRASGKNRPGVGGEMVEYDARRHYEALMHFADEGVKARLVGYEGEGMLSAEKRALLWSKKPATPEDWASIGTTNVSKGWKGWSIGDLMEQRLKAKGLLDEHTAGTFTINDKGREILDTWHGQQKAYDTYVGTLRKSMKEESAEWQTRLVEGVKRGKALGEYEYGDIAPATIALSEKLGSPIIQYEPGRHITDTAMNRVKFGGPGEQWVDIGNQPSTKLEGGKRSRAGTVRFHWDKAKGDFIEVGGDGKTVGEKIDFWHKKLESTKSEAQGKAIVQHIEHLAELRGNKELVPEGQVRKDIVRKPPPNVLDNKRKLRTVTTTAVDKMGKVARNRIREHNAGIGKHIVIVKYLDGEHEFAVFDSRIKAFDWATEGGFSETSPGGAPRTVYDIVEGEGGWDLGGVMDRAAFIMEGEKGLNEYQAKKHVLGEMGWLKAEVDRMAASIETLKWQLKNIPAVRKSDEPWFVLPDWRGHPTSKRGGRGYIKDLQGYVEALVHDPKYRTGGKAGQEYVPYRESVGKHHDTVSLGELHVDLGKEGVKAAKNMLVEAKGRLELLQDRHDALLTAVIEYTPVKEGKDMVWRSRGLLPPDQRARTEAQRLSKSRVLPDNWELKRAAELSKDKPVVTPKDEPVVTPKDEPVVRELEDWEKEGPFPGEPVGGHGGTRTGSRSGQGSTFVLEDGSPTPKATPEPEPPKGPLGGSKDMQESVIEAGGLRDLGDDQARDLLRTSPEARASSYETGAGQTGKQHADRWSGAAGRVARDKVDALLVESDFFNPDYMLSPAQDFNKQISIVKADQLTRGSLKEHRGNQYAIKFTVLAKNTDEYGVPRTAHEVGEAAANIISSGKYEGWVKYSLPTFEKFVKDAQEILGGAYTVTEGRWRGQRTYVGPDGIKKTIKVEHRGLVVSGPDLVSDKEIKAAIRFKNSPEKFAEIDQARARFKREGDKVLSQLDKKYRDEFVNWWNRPDTQGRKGQKYSGRGVAEKYWQAARDYAFGPTKNSKGETVGALRQGGTGERRRIAGHAEVAPEDRLTAAKDRGGLRSREQILSGDDPDIVIQYRDATPQELETEVAAVARSRRDVGEKAPVRDVNLDRWANKVMQRIGGIDTAHSRRLISILKTLESPELAQAGDDLSQKTIAWHQLGKKGQNKWKVDTMKELEAALADFLAQPQGSKLQLMLGRAAKTLKAEKWKDFVSWVPGGRIMSELAESLRMLRVIWPGGRLSGIGRRVWQARMIKGGIKSLGNILEELASEPRRGVAREIFLAHPALLNHPKLPKRIKKQLGLGPYADTPNASLTGETPKNITKWALRYGSGRKGRVASRTAAGAGRVAGAVGVTMSGAPARVRRRLGAFRLRDRPVIKEAVQRRQSIIQSKAKAEREGRALRLPKKLQRSSR